jgi:hypothetical protein
LPDTERIADREDDIADADRIRISERQEGHVLRFDLEHREIARLVGSDKFRVECFVVIQYDGDLFGSVNDVSVGQYRSIGTDDNARTETTLDTRLGILLLGHPELAEEVVVAERTGLGLLLNAA